MAAKPVRSIHTQVAIVGAGPAGLLLGALLHKAGIESVIVERQSREYVLSRIRAGILEQTSVDTLNEAGVGGRLMAEGIIHPGVDIVAGGRRRQLDMQRLVGRHVTAYGQTELTRDLMDARQASGRPTLYEAQDVRIEGLHDQAARVHGVDPDGPFTVNADWVAGCDGFHGAARRCIPTDVLRTFERVYPFGWLGLLADVPPASPHAVVYAQSDEGFALCSMRSLTRSRYYVQCPLTDQVEDWSDDRFWAALLSRLDPQTAAAVVTGPSIEKSIAPLRSFVAEPMRHGRLFLAGDAAHIVPPTGAKGLNLAIADVRLLSEALIERCRGGSATGIDTYSQRALERVWRVERFSWWATTLLHRFPDTDPFSQRLQRAELDELFGSERAQAHFADQYAGLPR